MAKLYDLRLKAGFPAPSRTRAGITVPAGAGVQTELSKEQLAVLKADPEIQVRDVSGAELTAQDSLTAEQQKSADEAAKKAEAESGKKPKEVLKKDLIAQAKAEGLEINVTEKNTKDEITQAIDAARANPETHLIDEQDEKQA